MTEKNKEYDAFNVKNVINSIYGPVTIYRLRKLEEIGIGNISRLPYSIKILLESLLRHVDGETVTEHDVELLAKWDYKNRSEKEIPFIPARIVLQDLTGVPLIVDLAALRSAVNRLGGDPAKINPVIQADLVIDHSIQADYYGTSYALMYNEKREFDRNRERYSLLRWAQTVFDNFHVVPPDKGIVHQVNLEYLASVVYIKVVNNEFIAYPDSLIGTDSHTTMINSLGILGWGVGGIEAEAVLLGQPYHMPIPEVVGFRLYGELKDEVNATDLVLTITQMLRNYGVVDKIVEFYGQGLNKLSVSDRATISNMSPEYGATAAFFPVDNETLRYLLETDRSREHVEMVKLYNIEQGLFRTDDSPEPLFSEIIELDMGNVVPSLAGPKRPQDRIPLWDMRSVFKKDMENTFIMRKGSEAGTNDCSRWLGDGGSHISKHIPLEDDRISNYTKNKGETIRDGSVVIAAITSCTNTSNPYVMIGAGILAKKAVEHGLKVKSYIKTSLAPGSRVVVDYLKSSGLFPYLEALGFHLVGYGCTTCIGNSGPIPENIAKIIKDDDLVVAAVLSGNRNFEGRINPIVKANYLASPPLVVAFAIAGSVNIDLANEPLGYDPNGMEVYLKDIWPTHEEINKVIRENLNSKIFRDVYSEIFEGTKLWQGLDVPMGKLYEWKRESTYIQEPPFFKNFSLELPKLTDIKGARVLAILGNSITTDHISPAGEIPVDGPSGKYLNSIGVRQDDFNSFGSRRGNHEVMIRGTFGNIHLRNLLVPTKEGGLTVYFITGEEMSIFDAATLYKEKGIPLIIIAGKEYGSGSSRDWAAKGTYLLGVRAIIAESYERIHRSNLTGMGILPLQFKEGDNAEKLYIKGNEIFDILDINKIKPRGEICVLFRDEKGKERRFDTIAMLDSDIELEYYRNGGILQTFLRNIMKQ
ncbi:MAG: aconitate hydratase AcnA [Candidatus Methanoperedens sp.]|nr:aconitate hydratase AcnA [Candidatus Methanoperedens sp.]